MDHSAYESLARWANFYLITGSAAAALTGLQFVVQTLLTSDLLRPPGDFDAESGIAAFGTPTVVHFSLVLILSTVMCIPWPNFLSLRMVLGAVGTGALVYAAIVMRRAGRQESYETTVYDWIAHVGVPVTAYASVVAGAVVIGPGAEWSLFLIAGAALLLLCIGIHNAWDTVTYLTIQAIRRAAGVSTPGSSR